jgi:lactoylglutathione lyase
MRMEEMRAPLAVCSAPRFARFFEWLPLTPEPFEGASRMNLTDVTPNLIVADIDRSTAFYRDLLGFSVVTTVPDEGPFVFVWLQRGAVNVFLNARAAAEKDLELWASRPAGAMSMFMAVEAASIAEGIDALFGSLESRVTVVMPLKDQFYGMREFGIQDPDGYVTVFAQRIA